MVTTMLAIEQAAAFWQNKKVFLTGHNGFKGSWMSLWLQKWGAELVGFSLPAPSKNNLFTIANVGQNMTSLAGDLRQFDQIKQAIAQHKPDIVIHMAAQSLVRYSYTNPIETYATNVMGTLHLLEAVKQVGCAQAILNITTDKCYQNNEWDWGYREIDALGGHDPYSNSKACSELLTAAYRSSYFHTDGAPRLATARAGNVIGGGDWAEDRLIPDIIRSNLHKEKLVIRNPEAIRPWQHVLESVSGYLLLSQKLYENNQDYIGAWNFGPAETDAKTVAWIADYVTRAFDRPGAWQQDRSVQPHEASYLKLDCAKAKSKLKWQPRWDLANGLDATIAWYKAFSAHENMHDFTLAQIHSFLTI
jgi:CDP-glucose 4,6-dehydratase